MASEKLLKNASPNGHEMLIGDEKSLGGCRAPGAGDLMRNPTLGQTFRALAQEGKKGFYQGRVAEELVKVVGDLGGKMTLDDLQLHMEIGSEPNEPMSLKFTAMDANAHRKGIEVWEHPPNGQGIVALIALGIIQELEKQGSIKKWTLDEHNSVKYTRTASAENGFGFLTAPVTSTPASKP